ncbi:osteoglycin, paralog b [Betta splendens]|uniref:Mimecan n=1 Tax=Betta splendens TaxID=158456 RepID=A0A6P7N149_BETSP|nr:osteoglycin, paralog b [Betta splendens]
MIQLRTFIFTSVMIPWILSSTVNNKYMDTRKSKRDVEIFDNYDVPQVSNTDQKVAKKPKEMPTCLLCVCLIGSVYCEEVSPEMSAVPTLPKETTYLYARFNKITKISNHDFANMATLRKIDLTGNLITEIQDGAFLKLPNLEELNLAENRLTKLPTLPTKLYLFDASNNRLKTQGVKATIFKKLTRLTYLYLGNNKLIAVPQLPESLQVVHLQYNKISTITDETFCDGNDSYYIRTNMDEVRLEGNPIKLSLHPNSFICLHALPIGWYD